MASVRKGDIVAVETRHSYQDIKVGRVEYANWMLATVAAADRFGTARSIDVAGATRMLTARDAVRPIANTALAAAARRVAKRAPLDVYSNDEDVRAVILKEAALAKAEGK